ncbi:hypothetical protein ACS0TY_031081 [Phlomoides rotata]
MITVRVVHDPNPFNGKQTWPNLNDKTTPLFIKSENYRVTPHIAALRPHAPTIQSDWNLTSIEERS